MLKSKLFAQYQIFRWFIDTIINRYKITSNSNIIKSLEDRYLVLLPHADDELIGCDQLLKSSAECILVNMNMEGGDSHEMHKYRYTELIAYANSVDRDVVTLSVNKTKELEKLIDNFKPNVICIPSCFDWHPEHFKVMRYLNDALIGIGSLKHLISIAMYQVSVPLLPSYINMALPMNREMYKEKWNGFSAHYKSQKHLPTYRFGSNERINGKLLNAYASESYIVMSLPVWSEILSRALGVEMERVLRPNINNLIQIRKELNLLYDRLFE